MGTQAPRGPPGAHLNLAAQAEGGQRLKEDTGHPRWGGGRVSKQRDLHPCTCPPEPQRWCRERPSLGSVTVQVF